MGVPAPGDRVRLLAEEREAELDVTVRGRAVEQQVVRPADAGRWQNMWEVPHGERKPGEELSAAAVRVAKELTGLDADPGADVATIRHGVTRYRITLACVEAAAPRGEFVPGFYAEAKWVTPAELADYPVSAPQRKLMTELAHPSRVRRLF